MAHINTINVCGTSELISLGNLSFFKVGGGEFTCIQQQYILLLELMGPKIPKYEALKIPKWLTVAENG